MIRSPFLLHFKHFFSLFFCRIVVVELSYMILRITNITSKFTLKAAQENHSHTKYFLVTIIYILHWLNFNMRHLTITL